MKKLLLATAGLLIAIMGFGQTTALHFDGVDDYVILPSSSKLNGLTKITIETWLNVTNHNSSPCADCAPIVWHQQNAYRFGTGNTQKVNMSLSIGGTTVTITSSKIIKDSLWHHIAGTYDGNKLRLFIDGIQTDSVSKSGSIGYSSSADVWIADPKTGYGGVLDEIRIWDYARNLKEIREGSLRRISSNTIGLAAQLNFEDGTPYANNTSLSKVKDNSPFKNDGSLNNFRLQDSTSNFVIGRSFCDTVVKSKFSISRCVKYQLPSKKKTVTQSGTYYDTIMSYRGCDSAMTIVLTILKPTASSFNVAQCDSFKNPISGTVYFKSGKYQNTLINKAGCDSIVTFNVTIYKKDTTVFNYDGCNSLKLNNGKTVFNTGIMIDSLKGFRGCDSFVLHKYTIRKSTIAKRTLYLCKFVISPSDRSTVYYQPGTYYHTLQNAAKCDSIIEYTVLSESSSGVVNMKGCGLVKSPSKKYTYTKSGTYYDTLEFANYRGCDSFITLNLTITSPVKENIQVTACKQYTAPSGTVTVNSTQTITDILRSKNGCDSILYTIDVTIETINTQFTRTQNTLTANTTQSGATFRWLDCKKAYSPVVGENQSSFSPVTDGQFALEVTVNNCTDTSACYTFAYNGISKSNNILPVSISPNPTSGSIAIHSPLILNNVRIEIMDSNGKIIFTENRDKISTTLLQLSAAAGIYKIKLTADQGWFTHTIMIK